MPPDHPSASESTANRSPTDLGEHYFSPHPAARSKPATVALPLPDLAAEHGDLVLRTDTAVFSGRAVDPGTLFLLTDGAHPGTEPGADRVGPTLVDVGCGYGPIAVTLALRAPAATVWAVDVNERALELCRANAVALGVGDRVVTATPAEVPNDLRVDGLWSNPPIRIGKPALHDLLTTWLGRLTRDGTAHLVVARNLGADSLARWLSEQGHAVTRRASRRGYRLLDVTGPASG